MGIEPEGLRDVSKKFYGATLSMRGEDKEMERGCRSPGARKGFLQGQGQRGFFLKNSFLHLSVSISLNPPAGGSMGYRITYPIFGRSPANPGGVREYPDWKEWATILEDELDSRGEPYTKISW